MIGEYLVFLSRRFSILIFKRNLGVVKLFKRDFKFDKKMVDGSKFICNNCGLDGHLSNECRKLKVENK